MTTNEALRSALLLRAVYLSRHQTGEVVAMIAALRGVDTEIRATLREFGALMESRDMAALIVQIEALNKDGTREVVARLKDAMSGVASAEVEYARNLLADSVPVAEIKIGIGPAQVFSSALTVPVDGMLVDDLLNGITEARRRMIVQAVRRAAVDGTTLDDLVRELYGTKANGYTGLMDGLNRRQAEAVGRTMLSHIGNQARASVWEANADVLQGVQWVATLDHRTCIDCGTLDGRVYDIDKAHATPPRHVSCRCVIVPVVKPWSELGIDPAMISEGARASMGGPVPETWTFADWIGRQSAEIQKDVLGKARYSLFKAGTPMTQFVADGRVLTLKELGAR